jgi:hypothetical protein
MHKIFEDPTYDEDGSLIDEEFIDPAEWEEAFPDDGVYDPFETINS